MKPTTFLLIRHAETTWNAKGILQGSSDVPLSKKGKDQTRSTALYLKTLPIDVIYTSPLKRARETAKEVAKFHKKAKIITEKALLERGFGSLEGLDYQTLYDKYPRMGWPEAMLYPFFAPEDSETVSQVEARVGSFFDRIKKKEKGKTVAIVSHGVAIRAMITHLSHMPRSFNFLFPVGNASVTLIRLHPLHGPEIHLLGSSSHIGEE